MTDGSHLTTTEESSLPDSYQKQDDSRPNSPLVGDFDGDIGTFGYLVESVRKDEKRRILAALVNHKGMTYDQLDNVTAVSRRRMRDRVYDLRDHGIVEVVDSKTVFVHFADDEKKHLAEAALEAFFG